MRSGERKDVLVVGAGPVGLALALCLLESGVPPEELDIISKPDIRPYSRAFGIWPRTLELLETLDVADTYLARGREMRFTRLTAKGHARAAETRAAGVSGTPADTQAQAQIQSPAKTPAQGSVALVENEEDYCRSDVFDTSSLRTKHQHVLSLAQSEQRDILKEALWSRFKKAVDYNLSLECKSGALEGDEDGVTVTFCHAPVGEAGVAVSGASVTASVVTRQKYRYVVGCDGAHSAVRKLSQIGFPGYRSDATWLLMDAVIDPHPLLKSDCSTMVDASNRNLIIFPLGGGSVNRYRFVALTRSPMAADAHATKQPPNPSDATNAKTSQTTALETSRSAEMTSEATGDGEEEERKAKETAAARDEELNKTNPNACGSKEEDAVTRYHDISPSEYEDVPGASLEEFTRIFDDSPLHGIVIHKENLWLTCHTPSFRIVPNFRKERVFLCGDAAHVISPVGGQGVNIGYGDAINLGWKLAAALRMENMNGNSASPPIPKSSIDELLTSYNDERRPVDESVVKATGVMTWLLTKGMMQKIRTVTDSLPSYFGKPLRSFMAHKLAQFDVRYYDSCVVDSGAGSSASPNASSPHNCLSSAPLLSLSFGLLKSFYSKYLQTLDDTSFIAGYRLPHFLIRFRPTTPTSLSPPQSGVEREEGEEGEYVSVYDLVKGRPRWSLFYIPHVGAEERDAENVADISRALTNVLTQRVKSEGRSDDDERKEKGQDGEGAEDQKGKKRESLDEVCERGEGVREEGARREGAVDYEQVVARVKPLLINCSHAPLPANGKGDRSPAKGDENLFDSASAELKPIESRRLLFGGAVTDASLLFLVRPDMYVYSIVRNPTKATVDQAIQSIRYFI